MTDRKRYKIVGNHPVAGALPGKTVELDLPADNIAALIKAGHIQPVPVRKAQDKEEKAGS